jgi:hypothetical protein
MADEGRTKDIALNSQPSIVSALQYNQPMLERARLFHGMMLYLVPQKRAWQERFVESLMTHGSQRRQIYHSATSAHALYSGADVTWLMPNIKFKGQWACKP